MGGLKEVIFRKKCMRNSGIPFSYYFWCFLLWHFKFARGLLDTLCYLLDCFNYWVFTITIITPTLHFLLGYQPCQASLDAPLGFNSTDPVLNTNRELADRADLENARPVPIPKAQGGEEQVGVEEHSKGSVDNASLPSRLVEGKERNGKHRIATLLKLGVPQRFPAVGILPQARIQIQRVEVVRPSDTEAPHLAVVRSVGLAHGGVKVGAEGGLELEEAEGAKNSEENKGVHRVAGVVGL